MIMMILPVLLVVVVRPATARKDHPRNPAVPNTNKNDIITANQKSASLTQILDNTRSVLVPVVVGEEEGASSSAPAPKQAYRTFPLPCDYLEDAKASFPKNHKNMYSGNSTDNTRVYVQESTTTLLAAKALAKTLNNNDDNQQPIGWDDLAWDMLDAVLLMDEDVGSYVEEEASTVDRDNSQYHHHPNSTTKATNLPFYFQRRGLLPKYWYLPAPSNDTAPLTTSSSSRTSRITQYHPPPHHPRDDHPWYVPGTRWPHWSLFTAVDHHQPNNHHNHSWTMESSHRLSAPPLQASILWDMLCAVIPPQHRGNSPSNRTSSNTRPNHRNHYSYNYYDHPTWWHRIERYYQRIFKHHRYLHTVVMRGCDPSTTTKPATVPCYNILHPWESLVDPTSPVWEAALQAILQELQDRHWTVPTARLPTLIRDSYDFPANSQIYEAMMYLLVSDDGGWNTVNLTAVCPAVEDTTTASCGEDVYWNRTTATNSATNRTPAKFAMLDVGYAALLAQADADLYQLGRVLWMVWPEDRFYDGGSSSTRRRLQDQLTTIEGWQKVNRQLLQVELWDERFGTYQSKVYNNTSGRMEFLDTAVSNNLVPFWNVAATTSIDADYPANQNRNHPSSDRGHAANSQEFLEEESASMVERTRQHWKDMSYQLLRRDEPFAFDCGLFPLWSQGCGQYNASGKNATTKPPMIQPIVNYLIANGLLQNDENFLGTLGRYISTQSLHMIAFGSNVTTTNMTSDSTAFFGEAYNAFAPYQNLATLDRCGQTSTLTAAIMYNLIVPDPSHVDRLPVPPIRRSWVITLITVELFVAFSIGVSCVLLSFSLMRRTSLELDSERNGDESHHLMGHENYEDEYGEHGVMHNQESYYDATTDDGRPAQLPLERNGEKQEDASDMSPTGHK